MSRVVLASSDLNIPTVVGTGFKNSDPKTTMMFTEMSPPMAKFSQIIGRVNGWCSPSHPAQAGVKKEDVYRACTKNPSELGLRWGRVKTPT